MVEVIDRVATMAMTLITCGCSRDAASGEYEERAVVRAVVVDRASGI